MVWENEELLAVNKPAGVPSQRTKDPKRYSMEHWAKAADLGPLYLTHRLDRDTSGVLLFARSKEMETSVSIGSNTEKFKRFIMPLPTANPNPSPNKPGFTT